MIRSASEIIEDYLARLRSELDSAGAKDTDDLVAEIRSFLIEAAGDDPEIAMAETERLGEPAELARGVLVESGLDPSNGMSTGVWWRLGIAAPIDILTGLALPLAAILPLSVLAWFGEPRSASALTAIALGVASLAWPFFIWRPWRRGGRSLSPGMTLTGLAVVRAPGFWRVVRVDELRDMGLAPRRRVGVSVVVMLVSVALLAGGSLLGLDMGAMWLASSAESVAFSGKTAAGGALPEAARDRVVAQVYSGLMGVSTSSVVSYVAPEAAPELPALADRIATKGIRSVRLGSSERVAPGVYRVEVEEYGDPGSTDAARLGSSTFTLGQRQWLRAEGVGSDWVVVAIDVGTPPDNK